MTWQEIEQQSGGRSKGTNSHPIPVDQLTKEARDRLLELQIDDVDELFSLRLEGKVRVFGVRSGHVMQLLWFDFEHSICESKKKNT